jgi:AmmeMemoRadiSam system protein A
MSAAATETGLTAAARAQLLAIARRAIEARLRGEWLPDEPVDQELRRPSGAFVTLRRRDDSDLRGCIGYIEALYPLAETVQRAAVSAATEDHRFDPVGLDELDELVIDISVLEPAAPIRPEDVRVGTHGLIVQRGRRRGLLLPQVPVEQGWDVTTFLDHTCLKAGLPPGAWRDPETRLLGFAATVFGEED